MLGTKWLDFPSVWLSPTNILNGSQSPMHSYCIVLYDRSRLPNLSWLSLITKLRKNFE